MAQARRHHTSTGLANGQVLIAGGYDASGNRLAGAELFDPQTSLFTAVVPMDASRAEHTATLLPDNHVLLVGGTSLSSLSAEIFDPASATFLAIASTAGAERRGHTATRLPDGRVLVVGGTDDPTLTAVLYDSAQSTPFQTVTASVTPERRYHAAILLPGGEVLIAGGTDGATALRTALLYIPEASPGTGSFATLGATMVQARYGHTVTVLADGRVLLAGGRNREAAGHGEIFDPGTNALYGTFLPTANPSLAAARGGHTANLLQDSRVLLVGGQSPEGTTLAAGEIFSP